MVCKEVGVACEVGVVSKEVGVACAVGMVCEEVGAVGDNTEVGGIVDRAVGKVEVGGAKEEVGGAKVPVAVVRMYTDKVEAVRDGADVERGKREVDGRDATTGGVSEEAKVATAEVGLSVEQVFGKAAGIPVTREVELAGDATETLTREEEGEPFEVPGPADTGQEVEGAESGCTEVGEAKA